MIDMGLVAYTVPEAGSTVLPQDVITIVVSLGLQVEVPSLIGYSYAEVETVLGQLNLIPTITGNTSKTVIAQFPEEGEFVDPSSLIEITIGD